MHVTPQYWQQLLNLKVLCDQLTIDNAVLGFSSCQSVLLTPYNEKKLSQFDVILSKKAMKLNNFTEKLIFSGRLYLYFAHKVKQDIRTVLELYLPIASSNFHHPNESFVIVHMAQSLDGKVCTSSGNSKWIGNQENLVHAHRIRALVDGVIVGGNTARAEKPSLNVRHVDGPNPARIFLCDSSNGLDKLPEISGMKNYLLCHKKHLSKLNSAMLTAADIAIIGYGELNKKSDVIDGLTQLREHKVNSVLVEGGPKTIRTFMENNAVTWLQIHSAPVVFGSGYSFVTLNEITQIDEARSIQNILYTQVGDAMMTTGEI